MTDNLTISEPLLSWLLGRETGRSSLTIVAYYYGLTYDFVQDIPFPRDPSDLKRCINVLTIEPRLRAAFPRLAQTSLPWKRLIDRWDELVETLQEEAIRGDTAPRTYAMMQQCFVIRA